MSQTIDVAFIKQFEAEVKLAYQRGGTKLRNTVRTKMNVNGKDTTFQIVGKGTAGTKTRHGLVPTMSLVHTNVTCTLADFYAADYVDKLDELKTNIDERNVVAQSAANALGRKTDDLVIQAADAGATNVITEGGTARLTQTKINTVFNYMGNNDVPDDGQRYWTMGPTQWTDMLGITAFSSADYVSSEDLPYKGGMVAKRWMGFMWFVHSGLNAASNIRQNLVYHQTAIGAASGQEVTSEWNYIPERAANLYNACLSQGAVVIDTGGLYKVGVYEA
jgi:uncharacterized protein (DUF1778 family)